MLHIAHALPDVSTNMVAHTFDLLLGNSVAEVTEIQHENSKEFYIQLYDTRDLRQSRFLFNPKNPKKSFDVYIDKNPKDTIHIKYTTLEDVEHTIDTLEKLYKQKRYTHQRIWQVGMIMKVRLKVLQRKNLNNTL
jgi:hypothetical protein